MDNVELAMIVVGIVSGLSVIMAALVVALLSLRGKQDLAAIVGQVLEVARPALESLARRADNQLAQLGSELQPAHQVIENLQTLIDEPEDWLVRLINQPAVIQALRDALAMAESMTDGEVTIDAPPHVTTEAGSVTMDTDKPVEAVK